MSAPQVIEERTYWALRVRVLDHEGVWGEPFYWWPRFAKGPTRYRTRSKTRSDAAWIRGEWCKMQGHRRVTATPVWVAVRTTIREVG